LRDIRLGSLTPSLCKILVKQYWSEGEWLQQILFRLPRAV
jgi:hypothetical protein